MNVVRMHAMCRRTCGGGMVLQLLCRFIRREKEIAETRRKLAEGENLRHKQLLESTQRQLSSVQAELKELCDSATGRTLTAAQHAEVLKKVCPFPPSLPPSLPHLPPSLTSPPPSPPPLPLLPPSPFELLTRKTDLSAPASSAMYLAPLQRGTNPMTTSRSTRVLMRHPCVL